MGETKDEMKDETMGAMKDETMGAMKDETMDETVLYQPDAR